MHTLFLYVINPIFPPQQRQSRLNLVQLPSVHVCMVDSIWLTSRDHTGHNVCYMLLHLTAFHEQIFLPVNIILYLFLKIAHELISF